MKSCLLFLLIAIPFFSVAQIVEEIIQIDTVSESIKVVYKPDVRTKFYTKRTAVFARDTAQVAIEKSFIKENQSGLYKAYYPNGQVKIKTVYAKNKLNGEWTYFSKNGNIITKGEYQNGLKEGYWAYRTLKIYGRYRKGLRFWRWHRIDDNKKRIKGVYKKGILVRGIEITENANNKPKREAQKEIIQPEQKAKKLPAEYEQAIEFLERNLILKKTLKNYFSQSSLKELRKLKQYYQKGEFRFVVAPYTDKLALDNFMESSINGEIVVSKIDSLLREKASDLVYDFNGEQQNRNEALYNNSTDINSEIAVYFSKIHGNLMRIDIVRLGDKTNKSDFQKAYHERDKLQIFEVLLYFDNDGKLKGAEYEKAEH